MAVLCGMVVDATVFYLSMTGHGEAEHRSSKKRAHRPIIKLGRRRRGLQVDWRSRLQPVSLKDLVLNIIRVLYP
jgi:hypothetical protein